MTAFRIVEACIFSIIDYSAIIFPIIKKTTLKKLETLYNNATRMIANTPVHIPCRLIYHQYNTLSFTERWQDTCNRYFSSLLRTPKEGKLEKAMENHWNHIKMHNTKKTKMPIQNR
eukprot:68078_1